MTVLFPIIYSAALTYLVWKAFKVMSNGWGIFDNKNKSLSSFSFSPIIEMSKCRDSIQVRFLKWFQLLDQISFWRWPQLEAIVNMSSHQNKKALTPFFGKLSYDHTDALHPIFNRIFGLNPWKNNLKWPNLKLFEKSEFFIFDIFSS